MKTPCLRTRDVRDRNTRVRLPTAALAATLAILALALGGCFTLSINPLYSEADLVPAGELDPGLGGVWGDPDNPEGETWQFIHREDGAWRLIIRDESASLLVDPARDGVFEAHLLRLDGQLYLDLYPEEPPEVNEYYLGHVIPAHSFMRIALEGHVLTMRLFDEQWLREAIEAGEVEIAHQQIDGVFVLTASTAELQALVTAHADAAFGEPETMQRLQ